MITSRKSGIWQLWLASFLAIGGASAYFADCAKATQLTLDNTLGEPRGVSGELLINPDSGYNIRMTGAGGNITIDTSFIVAIPDASGSITIDPSNSVPVSGSGGSISVRASSIVLDGNSKITSVPEPSSTLGILTFAVFSAAKALRGKQKN